MIKEQLKVGTSDKLIVTIEVELLAIRVWMWTLAGNSDYKTAKKLTSDWNKIKKKKKYMLRK